MNAKYVIFIGILFTICSLTAQADLNAYKYVNVSKRYDFQKSEDQYQINSLTKFLFEKKGFHTFFNDEKFPEELKINPCLALRATIIDESNLFRTKVHIALYNCKNELVLKTELGESKEKDYKKGFQEAIRTAFTTIENMPYHFSDDERLVDIIVLPEKKEVTEVSAQAKKEKVPEELMIPEKMENQVSTDPKYQNKVAVIAENQLTKFSGNTIEGTFAAANKLIVIQQQGNQYIISDDKNNVIGILYPTSQASYFIVKWLQSDDNLPKLVYLNEAGDVVIDEKNTTRIYQPKK